MSLSCPLCTSFLRMRNQGRLTELPIPLDRIGDPNPLQAIS